MKFYINHQQNYSRLELLLRLFFGWLYIAIPHFILIYILIIGFLFVRFFTFWIILFTGKYPKALFDYVVKFMRYQMRLNTILYNLSDGYPEFGLSGKHENMDFDVSYKENVSRITLLIRSFFGWLYVSVPHGIILFLRLIIVCFIMIIAWFCVLFTGKYPKGMFDFVVETLRWEYRVNAYLLLYTDEYPAFTGKVLDGETQ